MSIANESAFPESYIHEGPDGPIVLGSGGLTKREYFAAKALEGLLGDWKIMETFLEVEAKMTTGVTLKEAMAKMALSHADALIAELEND